MTSTVERVSVLEIKVDNVEEKIDGLKVDVKEMHDCLDRTRDCLIEKLETMEAKAEEAHEELSSKISSLEKDKNKITYMFAGGIAVFGFASGHFGLLEKLFH
jgi:uncharacterized coiled-coil protein SlyX